ncbi:CHAT domain-containing tetratricopeptide repeat protein [Novosphingobium sp. ERW19]|uniref:CHAT domain-containing tetratricopeptide repeat protein n=1 Tax=Novosphingobium sp. ERW19 TaxID=2726186 RepID=UPI0014578749|nr:CHAT domain-containing tetratricopeptide repeat protein [Novosphingobium sp. ERW19]NLR38980.1 CHAT domain-containing protein [Novosphingobium sp. ERW19]
MGKSIWLAALLATGVPSVAQAAEPAPASAPSLAEEVKALKTMDTAGKPAEALARIDVVLARARKAKGIDRLDMIYAEASRANALFWLDRYDEALGIYHRLEAELDSGKYAMTPDRAELVNNIGSLYSSLGKLEEASRYKLRALDLTAQTAGTESIEYASALYGMALVEFRRGEPLKALPRVREALRLARSHANRTGDDVEQPAIFGLSLAALLIQSGDTASSIEPAREAAVWAETHLGEDHRVTMAALNQLGASLSESGLYAQAIPVIRRTLDLRMKAYPAGHQDIGFSLSALGFALDNSGHKDEALPFYERAAEIFENSSTERKETVGATVIGQLARLAAWRGDKAQSLALREKALQVGRKRAASAEHPDVLLAEVNLAREYIANRRLDEASVLLDHANAAFRQRALDANFRRLCGLIFAEQIAAARGDVAGALTRTVQILAPARARLLDRATPRGEVMRLAEQYHFLFVQQARFAAGANDPAQAFEALQLANLGDLQSAMSSLAMLRDGNGAEATEVIRRYQSLASDGARLRRTLNAQVAAGKGDTVNAINRQLEEIDAKIRQEDARLAELIPGYSLQTAVEPAALSAAQKALAKGQALVLFGQDEDGLIVLAVTAEKAVVAESAIAPRPMLELIKRMRGSIDLGLVNNGAGRFDRKAAFELYQLLFPAPIRQAIKAAPDLRILAPGGLAALPFSALVTQAPEGADDAPAALRNTHWLALDHAVSVPLAATPLPQRAGGKREVTFAGIGAPILGQPVRLATRAAPLLRSGDTSTKALRELASLPGAADELRAMATAFSGKPALLIGADATEAAVKAAPLEQASVLAFATHGLVGGAFRDLVEPALVLTPPEQPSETDDGLLTASEIAKLRLDADWVILSACDTSAGDGESAPTYSGLARSFVAAGARSLLLSHWPVRDDVASRLTLDTLKGAGKGLSRAEGLRRAQLAILRDAKVPGGAHPATWAPFVLVGN